MEYDWERLSSDGPDEDVGNDEFPTLGEATDDEEGFTREECASNFLEMLITAHRRGQKVTAKWLTSLCFWAAGAGLEEAKTLALEPRDRDKEGGNAAKKVDRWYPGSTVVVVLPTGERIYSDIPICLPETLLAAISEESWNEIRAKHAENVATMSVPEVYFSHPVVQAHGNELVPVSLYIDGLSYSAKDSLLVLTMSVGDIKQMIFCVRKKRMCKCCGGWCTLYPLWLAITKSLQNMACGVRRAVALELKCDLAELAGSLGLASPASQNPCVLCKATLRTWHGVDWTTLQQRKPTCPFPLVCDEEFKRSVGACEVEIDTFMWSDGNWQMLLDNLVPNKRAKGILLNSAAHGLAKGDRLAPTSLAPDASLVGLNRDRPGKVGFWRPSCESHARHNNPLWTYCFPALLLRCDLMHTFCLGIAQQFLSGLLWEIMCQNVFGSQVHATLDSYQHNLTALDRMLQVWCKQQPDQRKVSKIDVLRVEALGSYDSQHFAYKAGDSLWFLRFMANSGLHCEEVSSTLSDWHSWEEAASTLVSLWDMMNEKKSTVGGDEVEARE
eukprot:4308938-Amphidinium_carterae.1